MSGSTVVAAMLGVRSMDGGDAPEVAEVLKVSIDDVWFVASTNVISPVVLYLSTVS